MTVREFLGVYWLAIRTEYETRGPVALVLTAFFFPLIWYAFKDLDEEEFWQTP